MKKNNRKGFTLAELLIVVAIIGVLVAVSIPIFTAQLRKARCATNQANARAAYAAAVTKELEAGTAHTDKYSYSYKTSDAVAVADATVATGGTTTAIADWTPETELASGKKAGDITVTEFQIIFTKDGAYAGSVAKTSK